MKRPDFLGWLGRGTQALKHVLEALPEPTPEDLERQEAKSVHKALAEAFAQKLGQREELCLLAWLGLRAEEDETLLDWAEARYPAWAEEKAPLQQTHALLKERLLLVRCSYKASAPPPPDEASPWKEAIPWSDGHRKDRPDGASSPAATPEEAPTIRREIQIFALVAGKPTKLAIQSLLPWSDFPQRLRLELAEPSSEALFTLYKKEA